MKVRLNDDTEIVRTIREGLRRTGGYCPLPSGQHGGEPLHMQRVQGADRRPRLRGLLPLPPVLQGEVTV